MKTNNIFQLSKSIAFNTFVASAFVAAFTLTSCEDDDDNDDPQEDTEAPVVTLMSPDDATTYHSGDTIQIHGNVTDNDGLHEIHISVTNDKGLPELHAMEHSHGQSYSIHEEYIIPTTMHTNITVTVEAEDHNGNKTTVTKPYHVHM